MYKVTIVASVLALTPFAAYGQCARIVGSNQIICPGYANSTPPVYTGPGYYGPRPGPGLVGARQVIVGAAGLGANLYQAYRGAPTPNLNNSIAGIANGYANLQRAPMIRYYPRIASPAPRPAWRAW